MAYRDTILADSPVDFYEMETGTGTDSGSGGRTLTLTGGITTGVPGRIGNGWSFDGVNDTASMATWPSLTTAFTFEAWVKPNLAGVNDTPTIVRRDGTDIHLLRVRGSAIGVNPGQAEVYADGLTLYSGSLYRVDDGNWHHIVYTQSGSTAKLYVDGVERAGGTTAQSTFNMGTGTGYIGSANGTGEWYKGTMDNVAIYNTALTAAKVLAHYNAGNVTNVEINEATGTMTLQGIAEAFVGVPNTYVDNDTAQVFLDVNEASIEAYGTNSQTTTIGPVLDETRSSANTLVDTTTTTYLQVTEDTGHKSRFQFSKSALLGSGSVVVGSIILKVKVQSIASPALGDINVGVTSTNGGTIASIKAFNANTTPAGYVASFDVTSLVNASGETVNLYLSDDNGPGSSWVRFHSMEATNSADRPTLTAIYEPAQIGASVDLTAVTMSLTAPDITIEAKRNIAVDLATPAITAIALAPIVGEGMVVPVATASVSAQAFDATVEAVYAPDQTVDVSTANASLAAVEANVSVGTTVEVGITDNTYLVAHDATVESSEGVIVTLDTPRIDTTIVRLLDVNGEPVIPTESEDPYFVATMNSLVGIRRGFSGGSTQDMRDAAIDPAGQIWFRMNETSGFRAYDRLTPINTNADQNPQLILSNVIIGEKDGPEGRHNFYFNGDSYAEQFSGADAAGEKQAGIEFTFRTTKKNQFIMGNADVENVGLSSSPAITWELWMVDGRLEVRTGRWYTDGNGEYRRDEKVHTAFTDYADGNWHHLVLQSGFEDWSTNRATSQRQWGLELFVDAKLELRRRVPAIAVRGFPDYIGGRPSPFYGDAGEPVRALDLARTSWFIGDMTEVVYRYGRVLSEDEVAKQRDTMMGVFPYYAQGPRINVQAHEAIVKGNKPRLLVLHFGQMNYERFGTFDTDSQPSSTSKDLMYAQKTYPKAMQIPFIGWGEFDAPNRPSVGNGDYLWTVKNVIGSDFNGERIYGYTDPVTDNYRLIDLEVDVNMDEYDVISIVGYPNNSTAWNKFYAPMDEQNAEPFTPVRKQMEDLMAQIREQVVHNAKGLYINDPFSAIALGIVDRVDFVPNFKESVVLDLRLGAYVGLMDWFSYLSDPFNGFAPGLPVNQLPANKEAANSSNEKAAARYLDTHANVKQRVRNTVEGLTTIPGWVKDDHIVWQNLNPMNEPPYEESISYKAKLSGLRVGDTFYMEGGYSQVEEFSEGLFKAMTRDSGWVASPVSNIKVGKAVTTFDIFFHATSAPEVQIDGETFFVFDADKRVGNPYFDHAVSIAVEPGDVWNGEIVTGKVYVNFTEAETHIPEGMNGAEIHDVDVGDVITKGNNSFVVSPLMARFNWSTHYGSWGKSEIVYGNKSKPDWGWSAGGVRGSGLSGGGGQAINWSWAPDNNVEMKYISIPTMSNRAAKWLSSSYTFDGSARVDVETATATIQTADVTAETVTNVEIDLSTARVQTEAFNDADTVAPDVTVLVPTTAVAIRAHHPVEEILLDTASVTLGTSDLVGYEFTLDWAEVMVLTLPRQGLILIMEDN